MTLVNLLIFASTDQKFSASPGRPTNTLVKGVISSVLTNRTTIKRSQSTDVQTKQLNYTRNRALTTSANKHNILRMRSCKSCEADLDVDGFFLDRKRLIRDPDSLGLYPLQLAIFV